MYCPKCAAQNAEDIKFCRVCGANLSLVTQALSGQLPEVSSDHQHGRRRRRERDHGGPANLGSGITKLFTGLGFIMVALALMFTPMGRAWWFWMLIPGFASLGKGIAEIATFKYTQKQQLSPPPSAVPLAPPRARNTGELAPPPALSPPPAYNPLPPPSVTEGTTRHLDPRTDPYQKER
jgi:hypothetical protein